MRLFVAIDLDDTARRAVADTQKTLARAVSESGGRPPKWVQPGLLHLTLVFLGEVQAERVPPLTAVMSEDLDVAPFEAVFAGLGVFPPRGAPQVLWLGVTSGTRELVDLQRVVAARLTAVGLPMETRPFRAHLTLARWRNSRPSDGAGVLALAGAGDVTRLDVDRVTLFQSQLSASGPIHSVLTRATLTRCPSSSSPRT